MKVLVTGATGFLGSHAVHALVRRGDEVVVLKRSNSDLARIHDVLPALALYNIGEVDRLLAEHGDLAAVLHTATCYGRNEPDDVVFETNTAFPMRLLQQAARAKVPLFVHTDTCFNTGGPLRYSYLRSYTLSKRQFTEWGEHFATRGDIHFVNVRLQHPYGPGDSPAKFVPSILRQCLDNVEAIRLTPGEQKKDFIYIADVVSALLLILDHASQGIAPFQEYECGSGEAVSIRHFVETAHALIDSRSQLLFGALPYRQDEIMHSCADTSSLEDLGWSPRYGLEDGLRQTLLADYGFLSPCEPKAQGHAITLR